MVRREGRFCIFGQMILSIVCCTMLLRAKINLTLFRLGFFRVPEPGGEGASKAPPPSINPKVLTQLT